NANTRAPDRRTLLGTRRSRHNVQRATPHRQDPWAVHSDTATGDRQDDPDLCPCPSVLGADLRAAASSLAMTTTSSTVAQLSWSQIRSARFPSHTGVRTPFR